MATNLKDALDKLTDLKYKKAVWETLITYLKESFLSRDGIEAESAIAVEGVEKKLVPEDIISEVVTSINLGPLKEIETSTNKILNIKIGD